MIITIIQKDLELAQKEFKERDNVSCSCLMYQAMKRNGYNVLAVGFKRAITKTDTLYLQDVDFPTSNLAISLSRRWPDYVGKRFKVLE